MEPGLLGEMADPRVSTDKYKMSLKHYFWYQKLRKCSENNEDMSKGHKNPPVGACTGQIWGNLST